jgi:hypothetical protein
MAKKGDNKRYRSVKAEFDTTQKITSNAGAIMIERVLRRLELSRVIRKYLPKRPETCEFSTFDVAYPFIAGLMVGGRGMVAAESLRHNKLDSKIFCLENSLPSEGTAHNAFADIAGLERRKFDEVYAPSGHAHPSLDLFGEIRQSPAHRRTVPEQPESAPNREALNRFTSAVAGRCVKTLDHVQLKTHNFTVLFGDATQLEVEGRCFDAARIDHNGAKSLQWATLMLGPIIVSQSLGEGSMFEAARLEGLIDDGLEVVRDVEGRGEVLGLYDSAYYHERVLSRHEALGWKYIMCANLHRKRLENIVRPLDNALWQDLGPDERRGWVESGIYVFRHRPGGWAHGSNMIALRYREDGDVPGVYHYSFFATNLEPEDLPKSCVRQFGYAQYVRMLYSTKQGHEVYYKTALEDFKLHNPPSGRLGINEVFYALAVAAVNVAMVIRYRVLKGDDRGMRFWRFRERYVRLAGRLKASASTLRVVLFGAGIEPAFQTLWLSAFADAARL